MDRWIFSPPLRFDVLPTVRSTLSCLVTLIQLGTNIPLNEMTHGVQQPDPQLEGQSHSGSWKVNSFLTVCSISLLILPHTTVTESVASVIVITIFVCLYILSNAKWEIVKQEILCPQNFFLLISRLCIALQHYTHLFNVSVV